VPQRPTLEELLMPSHGGRESATRTAAPPLKGPRVYTIEDDRGREIDFEWDREDEPTDADMRQIATAADDWQAPPMHPHARVGQAVLDAGRAALDPENLPVIGGVLGGIVGSAIPGAGTVIGGSLGATLGGGLGAAGRAMSRSTAGAPEPTAGELATDIGAAGAREGVTAAIGGGLVKGAGAVGRGLYRRALGPSRAVLEEFPDVVETGIRHGFNVTPKGAARAEAAGMASGRAAREVVRSSPAAAQGVRLKTDEVLTGLDRLRAAASKSPTANKGIAQIDAFADEVRASHPQGFNAEGLLDLKQGADKAGRAAHRAADVGGNMDAGAIAEMNKAIADRARGVLNEQIPGIRPINARTQSLMGVRTAIDEATARPSQLTPRVLASLGAGGSAGLLTNPIAGAGAAALTAAATSPRVLGRTGIVLGRTGDSAAAQRLASISAQAYRDQLLALLSQDDAGPLDNAGQPIAGASSVRP
jgi:hypothetical protein